MIPNPALLSAVSPIKKKTNIKTMIFNIEKPMFFQS